jgi:hypothetical protein
MRRVLAGCLAALLGASAASAATGGSAGGSILTLSFKTRQGPTMVDPHPPVGETGDTFDSSLELVNRMTAQLGVGPHAVAGSMRFSYTIRRQCAAFTPKCVATADFNTVSNLPGGTVIARGANVSIADPTITIPVVGGTGLYRRATGTVSISPTSTKRSIFSLTLP